MYCKVVVIVSFVLHFSIFSCGKMYQKLKNVRIKLLLFELLDNLSSQCKYYEPQHLHCHTLIAF